MLVAAIVLSVAWLAVAFLRQVGDVTTAAARAEALSTANAQLSGEIAALDAELRMIQRQQYVVIQARAHGLGESGEIPFALEQPLPSLAPDSPGSAGLRVGAPAPRRTALDTWLTLLFGPAG
jgi:cell division protein FtsB